MITPRRIAFVISTKSKKLKAGSKDTARVYSLLTNKQLGNCDPSASHLQSGIGSKEEFLSIWENFIEQWDSENQLFFYYSGHGIVTNFKEQFCLLFGDDDVPKNRLFFEHFLEQAQTNYRLNKVVFIIDACYSGKIAGLKGEKQKKILLETPPKGTAIITSSSKIEPSNEFEDGSYSIFTDAFCTAIETGLNNRPTQHGLIYIQQMVHYIKESKSVKKYSQTPLCKTSDEALEIWISINSSGEIDDKSTREDNKKPNSHVLRYINELDWKVIREYASRPEVIKTYGLKGDLNSIPKEDLVEQLNFYPESIGEEKELQKSAIICFHRTPEKLLKFMETAIVLVKVGQRPKPLYIGGNVFNQVEKVLDIIKENLNSYIDYSKSGRRIELPEIDEDLLREVLVNAYVHRDYNRDETIKIEITQDYLEIQNPGKFPIDIIWKDFITGKTPSKIINPTIAYYLKHLGIIEQINQGCRVVSNYVKKNGEKSITYSLLSGPTISIKIKRRKGRKMLISDDTEMHNENFNIFPKDSSKSVQTEKDLKDTNTTISSIDEILKSRNFRIEGGSWLESMSPALEIEVINEVKSKYYQYLFERSKGHPDKYFRQLIKYIYFTMKGDGGVNPKRVESYLNERKIKANPEHNEVYKQLFSSLIEHISNLDHKDGLPISSGAREQVMYYLTAFRNSF